MTVLAVVVTYFVGVAIGLNWGYRIGWHKGWFGCIAHMIKEIQARQAKVP